MTKRNKQGPRILILDIETAPIVAHVWGLWENNVALNQIVSDWHVMSWSAKWLDDKKVMYMDQRNAKDVTDDKKILEGIWKLIDEADIIVGQNQRAFDLKKLNARFILNGLRPPSSYRTIDTKVLASRKFKFSSNKLEYMTERLNKKYKKLKHTKFPGHSLWTECLKGNKAAWREMEIYNRHDVLSTEELYKILAPWDVSIDMNVYHGREDNLCQSCGSHKLKKNGYRYTNAGKFQRYVCDDCGAENKGTTNLLSKEKKASLKK